jgi:hypothetical protein
MGQDSGLKPEPGASAVEARHIYNKDCKPFSKRQ